MSERRWRAAAQFILLEQLGCTLGAPISQSNDFFDFAALVTVLLSFDRAVVRFSEGMFGVSYDFGDQVQRFGHSYVFLSPQGRSLRDARAEFGEGTSLCNRFEHWMFQSPQFIRCAKFILVQGIFLHRFAQAGDS